MHTADLFASVDNGLQKLSKETGCHCYHALWTMVGPIVVRWAYAQDTLAVNTMPGQVLPVTRSAAGRVFAAFMSHSETEPLIKRELALFSNAPEHKKNVRKKIAHVMSERCAISRGEFESQLLAIAVPFFDWHDRSIVVAGCVLPVHADEGRINVALSVLKGFSGDHSLQASQNVFAHPAKAAGEPPRNTEKKLFLDV
jgi:DNA-binding IclR family transcriptional regulator